MPIVDPIIADDALLLSLEASTMLAATNTASIIGFAHAVNTVQVDSIFGNAYAGSFFAGPLVSGQRQVIALVSNNVGVMYKLTGTLSVSNDGLGTGTITATPLSGAWNNALPHYLGIVSSVGSLDGTIDGVAWTSSVGFTLEMSGQILLRLSISDDICSAKVFTSRNFQGSSVSMVPFASVHGPDVSEVTTGLDDPSVWSAPQHRQFVGVAKDTTADTTADEQATLTYQDEKHTHAIVGAQFGDLEFDIGKSVPWVKYFTDDVFIADVNSGDPRYWVIDWDKTFPGSKVLSLGMDYFTRPVDWRKAQFAAADAAWHYSNNDWVLFVDGSEGLSCDTRSLPDDVTVSPFRSYIHREITRAEDAGKVYASLPWHVFVRNADQPDPRRFYQITNATLVQDNPVTIPLDQANVSVVHVAVPYYTQRNNFTERGMVRLIKVSALRDPAFNWSLIDTPSTPDDGVKVQLISYSYAHWTNPATGEDDGFKMRSKISLVRPMDGLPVHGTSTMVPPSAQGTAFGASVTNSNGTNSPKGLAASGAAVAFDAISTVALDDSTGVGGPYTVADQGVLTPIDGATAQTQPLLTPMYSSLFRVNPQDGVWYVAGGLAPEVTPPPWAYAFPPPTGFGRAIDAIVLVDQ